MIQESLESLTDVIRASSVFGAKNDIRSVAELLSVDIAAGGILNGDDAAAIPDGDGYLLLAAEGIVSSLISADPYLAGRSAVLANVNDIYAMGGRPLAMVDVITNSDDDRTRQICRGIRDNAARFGVTLVGGHTSHGAGDTSLSLAILGRARRLITSFDASPGDRLVLIYQAKGEWLTDFGFWNSTAGRPDADLRLDLELLPEMAESGLVKAGKDVSMAGIVGTALMLAEASRVGLNIELDSIAPPSGVPLSQWLLAFFSYGFLLAVKPREVARVKALVAEREITALEIGTFDAGTQLTLTLGGARKVLWDWREKQFTGFQKP